MKVRQWITGIVLLLLVAAAIARNRVDAERLQQRTRNDVDSAGQESAGAESRAVAQRPLVDQRPLQTAQRMAATGWDARRTVAGASRRRRSGTTKSISLSSMPSARRNRILRRFRRKPRQIADRKNKAEQALKEDQDSIALLTHKLAAAPESQKDNLQDQIDVAKAQMDLDQDEVDDAAEDLEQAGGDPQSKIKRLQAEHEAGDHSPEAAVGIGGKSA